MAEQLDIIDLIASIKARDEGIKTVSEHNSEWVAEYLTFVTRLPVGWIGTAEDIRAAATFNQPKHPNAWGAACSTAVRRGLLEKTGNYVKMKFKKSHARATPEYRRVSCGK